jgi:putative copper export protein/methionine-rich copper-binding protein CopC
MIPVLAGARPRHFAVAVFAFAGALLLVAQTAWAHPYLVQTVPGPGAVISRPPPVIEIGLTERVVLEGSSLRLEDAAGRPLPLGAVRAPKGGPGLAADVGGTLASAVYTVRWVALGDDGHTASGDFRFGVAGPGGEPPPGAEQLSVTGGPGEQAQATDGPLRVALRWLGLLGASLFLGGSVLTGRLRGRLGTDSSGDTSGPPEVEPAVTARWLTLSRLAWLFLAAAAPAAVLAAASAGTGSPRLGIVLATSTGTLALAQLGAFALAAVPVLFMRPGPTRDNLLGTAGALFLGAEAAGGHLTALTGNRLPAGLAQAAHLTAAGIWVGGLVALAFLLAGAPASARSAAVRRAAAAFGPVAVISAVVVVVTGTLAAIREVDHLYFLRWSTYGRFLLVKLALVAAMLALGAAVGRRLRHRRAAAPAPRSPAGLLRSEAVLGVVVLVFAATLVGSAQGRGQPLPAQRGSVLAGPAFANAVVAGGVARLLLAPASPGRNRLTVLLKEDPSGTAGAETARAGGTAAPQRMQVSLECTCVKAPVTGPLIKKGDAWQAELELPAGGIWRASLTVDGNPALAPVALRVAQEGAPGAPPVVVAAPADLSGPDARRCRSFQLGMLLALALRNADGGVGGRKIVLASADDGGDPGRARQLAVEQRERAVDLAAPCGRAAGAAAQVLERRVPVVMADALAPVVGGSRVFRLAADPYAEGWAVGRAMARGALVNRPDVPRRLSVVVDADDASASRAVDGLRAALALPPDVARPVENTPSQDTSDVEVVVTVHQPGTPLLPEVRRAIDPRRFAAAFLRSAPGPLAAALDQLTAEELAGPATVFVPSRHFDEGFYRASKLGRRGDIVVLGEVAPDSGDSLVYTRLISGLFPGEQASIDGLRGYMAGKAIVEGLRGGADRGEITRRLQLLGFFADGLASGWSPGAPAAGSWRFFSYKGSFIPGGLQPGEKPEPGRFFPEGGAWSRVVTANIGLCGPQTEFEGPPPPCVPLEPKNGKG